MSLGIFLLAMIAGGLGAGCRYALDSLISNRMSGVLPLGTMAVNLSGSFALGVLMGLAVGGSVSAGVLWVIGGGFLGAYTTFSTWMLESWRLIEAGSIRAAVINLVVPLAAGWMLAIGGVWIGSQVLS